MLTSQRPEAPESLSRQPFFDGQGGWQPLEKETEGVLDRKRVQPVRLDETQNQKVVVLVFVCPYLYLSAIRSNFCCSLCYTIFLCYANFPINTIIINLTIST